MKERLHLYAQPHPEVEEDEKAKGEDEEEEGGELVKRVVLVVKVLLHIFQAEKGCGLIKIVSPDVFLPVGKYSHQGEHRRPSRQECLLFCCC